MRNTSSKGLIFIIDVIFAAAIVFTVGFFFLEIRAEDAYHDAALYRAAESVFLPLHKNGDLRTLNSTYIQGKISDYALQGYNVRLTLDIYNSTPLKVRTIIVNHPASQGEQKDVAVVVRPFYISYNQTGIAKVMLWL